MAGIPISKPESIGALSVVGSVIALGPSRLNLGGRQYVTTTSLQVTMSALTANTLYYLYVTLSAGVPVLSISTSVNSVGPGATLWKLVGAFYAASATTLGSFVTIDGTPVGVWLNYSPTIVSGQGTIVPIAISGRWRRVGDSMEVATQYDYSSGTGAAANFALSTPFTMSGSGIIPNGLIGSGFYYSNATGFKNTDVRFVTSTSVIFTKDSVTGFVQGTDADDAGSGISSNFKATVSGWSNTPLKDL